MSTEKLILAGTLLCSASEPVLRNRLVRITGDRIDAVEPLPDTFSPEGRDVVDARDKVVIPGFVNAHTHHTEILQRSLRDRLPFELWHFERRGTEDILDPGYDDLLAANHIALLESLKHGTTSVLHHLSRRRAIDLTEVQACVDAAQRLGVRTAVAPSATDGGWRAVPVREASETGTAEIAGVKQALDLIAQGPAHVTGVVAPTSLHTCSDSFLTECLVIAEDRGLVVHTHFMETRSEAQQRSAEGETPVRRAARLGLLNPGVSLAHAVHLTDEELDLLGETQPAVVHNPSSNAKLGSGLARVREMLNRGITVALGSDGGDTSDGYSMFDQMKMAAVMRRCSVTEFESWITAREAFAMATTGGANVLGIQAGRIAPGHLADICILKPGTRMWPSTELVQSLVYSENGRSVDTVLVGGEVLLENGRSLRIDESELARQAEKLAAKVDSARQKWAERKRDPEVMGRERAAEESYREAASTAVR